MNRDQSGQTLVALLSFMTVAITITTAATLITVESIKTTTIYSIGNTALSLAETGAENALLRLARDPAYSGESLNIAGGTAIISISPSLPSKTITSEAVVGDTRRKVQVQVTLANNQVTITSWKEVP